MEYLVIAGIVLIILVPLTYLYFKYTSESSYAIATSKVDAIANEISRAANDVYAFGRDSQLTIEADFPDGIQQLEFRNNEIIFTILDKQGKTSEIAKVSDATFSPAIYQIFQGRKKIIVKSLGTQVQVTIQ